LDNRLGEIKQKTLIIWGKQDGLILLEDGESYNKGIAGAKLSVIDKCGHIPQFRKGADFNKKVLEFLEK
jgi:2-hydroxy-6-oxonona-2,4-dienedioate hydrolase